jgi:hypothetical protein
VSNITFLTISHCSPTSPCTGLLDVICLGEHVLLSFTQVNFTDCSIPGGMESDGAAIYLNNTGQGFSPCRFSTFVRLIGQTGFMFIGGRMSRGPIATLWNTAGAG